MNQPCEAMPNLWWGGAPLITPEHGFDSVVLAALECPVATHGKVWRCGMHGEARPQDPRNTPEHLTLAIGRTLIEVLAGRKVCVACHLGETRSAAVVAACMVLLKTAPNIEAAYAALGDRIKPSAMLTRNIQTVLGIP